MNTESIRNSADKIQIIQSDILIIDDDTEIITSLKKQFSANEHYQITTTDNSDQAKVLNHRVLPAVVYLDMDLINGDSIELVNALRQENPSAIILVATSQRNADFIVRALRARVSDCLFKPVNHYNLVSLINQHLEKRELETKLRINDQLHWQALESIEEGILVVNNQGHLLNYNTQFARLWKLPNSILEYQDDELLINSVLQQLVNPGAFLDKVQKLYKSRAIDRDKIYFKDGRVFDRYSRPLMQDTQLVGRLWAFRDITQQIEAEQALNNYKDHLEDLVKKRTHELNVSNKELESFGYSVSHDLRTPLRAIDGYSHILLQDYSDEYSEEQVDYLQRIRSASQRMSVLIDDLLQLSRVSQQELNRVGVDLSALANEISTELKDANPEKDVLIAIQPELVCDGDKQLIRQLLSNLMGNAWKFSANTDRPKIEIGKKTIGNETAFYVCDNGIGVEMEYAHKLFQAFERLHSKTEFEGSGVGLATVKRIVTRHEGRVWVESEIGQGACFYFTLSSSQDRVVSTPA